MFTKKYTRAQTDTQRQNFTIFINATAETRRLFAGSQFKARHQKAHGRAVACALKI